MLRSLALWNCILSESAKWNLQVMLYWIRSPFAWYVNITSDRNVADGSVQTQRTSAGVQRAWSSKVCLNFVLHNSFLQTFSVCQSPTCNIAYVLTKGSRNLSPDCWASWTFWSGQAWTRRATCLLPPSLGHGGRKQAGSRLRLGPTFPTHWRELLS